MQNYYSQAWNAAGPKANVLFIPGYGGHSGYIKPFAQLLNQFGVSVLAIDLFGFGKSPGERGHIDGFEIYLNQILDASRSFKSYYLLGQSNGSLLSLLYGIKCDDHNLEGIIAGAPSIDFAGQLSRKLINSYGARILSHAIPKKRVATPKPHAVHDPLRERKERDPLRVNYITLQFAAEIFRAQEYVRHHAHELNLPVLVLQGMLDATVPPSSVEIFAKTLPNAVLRLYGQGRHNMFEGGLMGQIAEDISDWMNPN